MRKCIWCNKTEKTATFNNRAHTIPQSIGGQNICEDVCDKCNNDFGSPGKSVVAVEVALKELLNAGKYLLTVDKNAQSMKFKKKNRFKSTYFEYSNNQFKMKKSFRLKSHLYWNIARQFKRGIYKVVLEEYHRKTNNGFNDQFDFIREFAKLDLGDLPVIYFRQRIPAMLVSKDEFDNPELYFDGHQAKVIKEFGFYEFRLIARQFAIPFTRNYNYTIKNYIGDFLNRNKTIFKEAVFIERITDFDIFLDFMKN